MVSDKYKVKIFVSPQHTDIKKIAETQIPVIVQHISSDTGPYTGHVSALSVKYAGGIGTFINHSENKLNLGEVKKIINLAKKYELKTFCFAASVKEGIKIAKCSPDFLIYEPPELIGSSSSVSMAKPNVIAEFVKVAKNVDPKIGVLCGAGITNVQDVRRALELGAEGVVLSSAFVKSKFPEKFLEELISLER